MSLKLYSARAYELLGEKHLLNTNQRDDYRTRKSSGKHIFYKITCIVGAETLVVAATAIAAVVVAVFSNS